MKNDTNDVINDDHDYEPPQEESERKEDKKSVKKEKSKESSSLKKKKMTKDVKKGRKKKAYDESYSDEEIPSNSNVTTLVALMNADGSFKREALNSIADGVEKMSKNPGIDENAWLCALIYSFFLISCQLDKDQYEMVLKKMKRYISTHLNENTTLATILEEAKKLF